MSILKDIVGAELDAQIDEKLKGSTIKLADLSTGEYVGAEKYKSLETQFAAEQTKVKERDTQLAGLGDVEGMKETIKTLQADNAKKDAEAAAQRVRDQKIYASKLAFLDDPEYKPHDINDILTKIDIDKIELDENSNIKSGLKEQRDNLVKADPWRFEAKTPATTPKPNSKPIGTVPADGNKKPGAADNTTSFGADLASRRATRIDAPKTVADINPWGKA